MWIELLKEFYQDLKAHRTRAFLTIVAITWGTIAVVLGVSNETELLAIAARLTTRGVAHVLIRENAGTFDGQATAIGVRPTHDRKTVGKAVSSLRLVR